VSETVLTALITASAGLLGALVGFAGSLIVSIRSARLGREQVRYARAYERRDEVIATLYGHLFEFSQTLLERASSAINLKLPDANDLEEVLLGIRLFHASDQWGVSSRVMEDFKNYFAKNGVWIPDDVNITMTRLFDAIDERNVKLRNLAETLMEDVAKTKSRVSGEESPRVPAVVTAIKEFYDVARETNDWLEGDFSQQDALLRKRIKKLLQVEDD
jgi:hypothetical protein